MKEYPTLSRLIAKMKDRTTNKAQFNLGAVVVDKRGNPLAYGFNSYSKTHPIQKLYNRNINDEAIFLHAEISALVKCINIPQEAYAMIVARLGKDGKVRLAKPCKGCFAAIKDSKINKVFYTNDRGELVLLDTSISILEYKK